MRPVKGRTTHLSEEENKIKLGKTIKRWQLLALGWLIENFLFSSLLGTERCIWTVLIHFNLKIKVTN
jgi:hypothetical protein